MNQINPILSRLFALFELILTFFIINFIVVVFSLVSLFALFPVLIAGIFHLLIKVIQEKDTSTMFVTYVSFVRRNVLVSLTTSIIPFISTFLILSVVWIVNPLIVDLIPSSYLFVIRFVQIFMIYILSSVFLLSLIYVAYGDRRNGFTIMRDSFFVLFAKPVRLLIAYIAMAVVGYVLFYQFDIYFLLLAIPILASIYFLSISVYLYQKINCQ